MADGQQLVLSFNNGALSITNPNDFAVDVFATRGTLSAPQIGANQTGTATSYAVDGSGQLCVAYECPAEPSECDTLLDCAASSASIQFTDRNISSNGSCEWQIDVDWIDCDGAYAGNSPRMELSASVGTVTLESTNGVTDTYRYLLPQSVTATPVMFTWGVTADGVSCTANNTFPPCDDTHQTNIFGFAADANVTGGQNQVVVSTLPALRAAVNQGGNYVRLDPSLTNGFFTQNDGDDLIFGANTTLDGRDAPGFELRQIPMLTKIHSILLNQGNAVVCCLKLVGPFSPAEIVNVSGDTSAGIFGRTGSGYWIDHVTVTGMDDDGIFFGDDNSPLSARDVTVSFCHFHDTDKGLAFVYNGNDALATTDARRFTAAYNLFEGHIRDRVPYIDGTQDVHFFNNHVQDVSRQGEVGRAWPAGLETEALFENNSYAGTLNGFALSQPSGGGGWNGTGYLYHNGLNSEGNNLNGLGTFGANIIQVPNGGQAPGPVIPYTYNLLDESAVPAYVMANAGADNC